MYSIRDKLFIQYIVYVRTTIDVKLSHKVIIILLCALSYYLTVACVLFYTQNLKCRTNRLYLQIQVSLRIAMNQSLVHIFLDSQLYPVYRLSPLTEYWGKRGRTEREG